MKAIVFLSIIICFIDASAQRAKVITIGSERDLVPEGIAIDSKTGTIYISSINKHKIIAFNNGKTKDLITTDQDGFMEGLGLKVDEKRRWLWALSVLKNEKWFYSKVHAFDLETGKTMQQYSIQDTLPHLFNDLVITDNGNVFITDTYYSAVYKLDPKAKKLDLFIQSPLLRYPNGLTFGNDRLYIATYRNTIVTLDTATKEIKKLNGISDTTIALGLDGLLFQNNTLLGVYNIGDPPSKNCIIQYSLSGNGDSVQTEKIIDQGNPSFADPTTAALYKNRLYVIANSHLDAFNANKTSTKGIEEKLKPVTLLVYDVTLPKPKRIKG
jgi:outer membrane protein assembly factor BamB